MVQRIEFPGRTRYRDWLADHGDPQPRLTGCAREGTDRPQAEVDGLQDKPAATPTPEESTIAGEQQRRVRAALAVLPDSQRQLIELAWYGGYSHSELAGKMGLPLGTVKTRLRMALARLRQLLDPVGGQAQ